MTTNAQGPFAVRAVVECGWNLFRRQGYADRAPTIALNYGFLEQLAAAGINWLIVFWANGQGFDDAWGDAAETAGHLGIRIARAVYGFSAGGPEHGMAEPSVPEALLRPSRRGSPTAICPHDEGARDWLREQLARRLEPNVAGLLFEPAREIGRNCICARCASLSPAGWDAIVLEFLTKTTRGLRPNVRLMAHVNQQDGTLAAADLAHALHERNVALDHVFAWGVDQPEAIGRWLDAEPRFTHFARLGRHLLFPDNELRPVGHQVAAVFAGCRLSAERHKPAYAFDYRMFGGTELGLREPVTRRFTRLPASLAMIGAALANPYASEQEQADLVAKWRADCDWDLDDPRRFYVGEA